MCYSLWYNAPTMLPAGGHPLNLLNKGHWVSSPRVKWPWHGVTQPPLQLLALRLKKKYGYNSPVLLDLHDLFEGELYFHLSWPAV